jgi:hypothetical protein
LYMADFLPLLIMGASVGAVSIWARLRGRPRRARIGVACVFAGVALLEVVANTAVAVTPSNTWTSEQTVHYVEAQQQVSNLTGHPLAENVELGYALPVWAPADQLFVEGYCDSVYISDGEEPRNTQFGLGSVWLLVERSPHGHLCPLLVDEGRLTPVLRPSLVRADAAFLRGHAAFDTWLLDHSHNADNAMLSRANSQQVDALRRFDLLLHHLVNLGLPGARARAITARLLAESGSVEGTLSNTASQNQSGALDAGATRDVIRQWSRLTSDYSSLLHELVVPTTG